MSTDESFMYFSCGKWSYHCQLVPDGECKLYYELNGDEWGVYVDRDEDIDDLIALLTKVRECVEDPS